MVFGRSQTDPSASVVQAPRFSRQYSLPASNAASMFDGSFPPASAISGLPPPPPPQISAAIFTQSDAFSAFETSTSLLTDAMNATLSSVNRPSTIATDAA